METKEKDFVKLQSKLENIVSFQSPDNVPIDEETEVVRLKNNRGQKKKAFTARRNIVLGMIFALYMALVLLSTYFQAHQEGVDSILDARWQATFLSKLLDWLFLTGPATEATTVNGQIVYQFAHNEILRWMTTVLLSLIGWGSVITIPTFLVDEFVTNASNRDELVREKIREEEHRRAAAKINGRLEIATPHYTAILTGTYDSAIHVLIKGLELSKYEVPLVLFQSKEKYNIDQHIITDHVYIPDLSSERDYDELAHVRRIEGHGVVILTNKPDYKFLCDPQNPNEVDLSAGDVVKFAENIRERTNGNVRFVICGSPDLQVFSEPYLGDKGKKVVNLQELTTYIDGKLINPDEVILKRIYNECNGKPVYFEFSGTQEQIDSYSKRLHKQLKVFASDYPIKVISDSSKATGGIYFLGPDAEAVALSNKRMDYFDVKNPHYVIFENIDRLDEIQNIGFKPICVDSEISIAIIKALA